MLIHVNIPDPFNSIYSSRFKKENSFQTEVQQMVEQDITNVSGQHYMMCVLKLF